jgi:hypothetical protein
VKALPSMMPSTPIMTLRNCPGPFNGAPVSAAAVVMTMAPISHAKGTVSQSNTAPPTAPKARVPIMPAINAGRGTFKEGTVP